MRNVGHHPRNVPASPRAVQDRLDEIIRSLDALERRWRADPAIRPRLAPPPSL